MWACVCVCGDQLQHYFIMPNKSTRNENRKEKIRRTHSLFRCHRIVNFATELKKNCDFISYCSFFRSHFHIVFNLVLLWNGSKESCWRLFLFKGIFKCLFFSCFSMFVFRFCKLNWMNLLRHVGDVTLKSTNFETFSGFSTFF